MFKKYLTFLFLFFTSFLFNQTIGKTTTEDYQAEFEKRASIYSIPEYNGDPVPVALLNIGVTEDVLNMYPELRDYRVGLGLTNITVAFLDETFRFEFVETRDEIKDRMVNQYKASQKGFTANDVNIMGNINIMASCLPYMRETGWGRVILISSIFSELNVPKNSIYCSITVPCGPLSLLPGPHCALIL